MKIWAFPLALSALAAFASVIFLRPEPLAVSSARHRTLAEAPAQPWTAVRAGRETTGSIR